MKQISNLLLVIILSSCANKQSEQEEFADKGHDTTIILETTLNNQTPLSIHREFGDVKFLFSDLTDPNDLGLYQKLQITVKDSLALQIASKTIELEGQKFGLNEKSIFEEKDRTLFIVEVNNRPEPSYFIIISKSKDFLEVLGETEPLTADLFGDIDNDGLLEIGGFNTHCQGNSEKDFQQPDFCLEHFRIYEIESAIRRDTVTEENILNMRQQKQKSNTG